MKIVIQVVNSAKLTSEEFTSEIGFGVLVTVGVNHNDTIKDIEYLARKLVSLRQFRDQENKRVSSSLLDVKGECMCVSNFTIQARVSSGTRPDFSHAADNEFAYDMYNKFMDEIRKYGVRVEKGNFGKHMHIECCLDGPYTIILESEGRK